MCGLNKHEILAAVLWGVAVAALCKYGLQEPWVMAMAGFNFSYGYCHRAANGFRLRSFFAGVFGALAGFCILGLIWAIGEGSGISIFGLTSLVSIGITYHIGRKVTA